MANFPINPDRFELLLRWLDPDRNRAAESYEVIRRKLITLFKCRGFGQYAEDMADDVIDRVMRKLPEICGQYSGNPEHYFLSFVRYVALEWKKRIDMFVELLSPDSMPVDARFPELEEYSECLERCLHMLPSNTRDLVLEYYQYDKREKIDRRALLADSLGVGANALRIRVCRIRKDLERCVQMCVNRAIN